MTKKGYQAIARAIYSTREMIYRNPEHDVVRNELLADLAQKLGDVMYADNPGFDRARFEEACETGKCKGMPR